MDYRLDGLSARTFEHLVRSLSLEAISSTSTPFGDGPDGGREAIFDGLTDYGPDSARWNGYGVIQAKFLQRTQDTRRDGLWLLRELKKEISKFTRKSRPLRAPKYYIIATNVVLSPTEGTGIKDKVLEQLRSFQEQCKLANFDFLGLRQDSSTTGQQCQRQTSLLCLDSAWRRPNAIKRDAL